MGQFDEEDRKDEFSSKGDVVSGGAVEVGEKLPMVKVDDFVQLEDDSIKETRHDSAELEDDSLCSDMRDDSVEARMERKFELMLEGRKVFSDLKAPEKPPPWLDKEVS